MLTAHVTLNDTGDVSFNNTVNGDGSGPWGLTVNAAGATRFNNLVGNFAPLASLMTDDPAAPASYRGGSAFLNTAGSVFIPSIHTTGNQTYNDAVVLLQDTVLASVFGGAVVFNNTVDGPAGLAIDTAGTTRFNDLVGNTTPLSFLFTDVPTAPPGELGGTTEFNMNAANAAPGSGGVNVGQLYVFDPLTLNVANSSAANPSVKSTADQTYNAPVTLSANTLLASSGGGPVRFASTVTGAGFDLDVNTAGQTEFDGPVSGVNGLSTDAPGNTVVNSTVSAGSVIISDPLDLNGGSVTTVGGQTYAAPVTLSANTLLASSGGGLVRFASTVTGAGFDLDVNTAGQTEFDGPVSGVNGLSTDAPGNTVVNSTVSAGSVIIGDPLDLNGGSVTTVGGQTYAAPVTLSANTLLASSGGGLVRFASTVTGAGFDLDVNTAGQTEFDGAVSGVNGLSTDAPGNTVVNGTISAGSVIISDPLDLNGGSVTTVGGQTYAAPVTLSANTLLASSGGGLVRFASTVTGAGFDLDVNTAGQTEFDGPVSGVNGLSTDAPGNTVVNSTISAGSVIISDPLDLNGGSVTTVGGQTYAAPVTLSANTLLASSGGGLVRFGSTVTGAGFDLDVNTAGQTEFDGAVSGVNGLSTDAPGNTVVNSTISAGSVIIGDPLDLNGGSVTTVGGQTYAAPVTLSANTLLASSGGGLVRFASTITGAGFDLDVNTAGQTEFDGAVSGVNGLSTDAPGNTVVNSTVSAGSVIIGDPLDLNGGSVTTVGGQTYAAPVTLSANTLLASSGGGLVRFGSTVSGAGFNLAVNTAGQTEFDGAVSGVNGLSTDAPGNTVFNSTVSAASVTIDDPLDLNGGSVTTVGNQTYNAPLTLTADTTLSGANVTLASTVSGGGNNLTVNAGSATTIGAAVSGLANATFNTVTLALNGNLGAANTIVINNSGAVSGAGQVQATTLNLNGAGDVGASGTPLNTAVNYLVLNKTAPGNSFISEADGLNLSGSTGNGNLTLSDAGLTTLNAALNAGAGTVTLDGAVAGPGLLTASLLNLNGAGNVGVSPADPLNTAVGSLVLARTGGNSFISEADGLNLSGATGNGNLTLADAGLTTLNAALNAGAGTVTLDGAVAGPGLLTASLLNLNGAGNVGVSPADPLNTAVGSLVLARTGGNSFISEADGLNLSGSTGNGNLTLADAGLTTLNAALNAGAGTVTLDGAVAGPGLLTASLLNLNGAGNVGVSPADPLNTAVGSLVLARTGGNSFISEADGLNLSGSTGNGNLTLSDAGLTTLNAALNAGAGTVTLDGAVAGPGLLTASLLNLNGAGNVGVSPADPLNTAVGSLVLARTGGNSFISEADGLNLSGSTGGGDLSLVDGGLATVSGILNAGAGTVSLNSALGVSESGGAGIVAANLLLQGSGSFDLSQPANDVATLAANVNGALTYQDGNALTIGSVGATRGLNSGGNAIALTAGGPITIGTGIAGEDITAAGATLSITSSGDVAENVNSRLVANTLQVSAAGSVLLGNDSAVPAAPQPQNQIVQLGQSAAGGVFYLYNALVTPRPAAPVIPGAIWLDPNDNVQKQVVGLSIIGAVENSSASDTIIRTLGDLDLAASGSVVGNGGRIILSAETGDVAGNAVNNSSFHNFTAGNTPQVRSQASSSQMGTVYIFSQEGGLNTPPDAPHSPAEQVSQGRFFFGSTVPTDNLMFSDAVFSIPNFDSFLSAIANRPGGVAGFRNPQPALWSEYANIFVEPVKLPTLSVLEFEVDAAYETNRAKMKGVWTSSYDIYKKKKASQTPTAYGRQVSSLAPQAPLVAEVRLALKPETYAVRNED